MNSDDSIFVYDQMKITFSLTLVFITGLSIHPASSTATGFNLHPDPQVSYILSKLQSHDNKRFAVKSIQYDRLRAGHQQSAISETISAKSQGILPGVR